MTQESFSEFSATIYESTEKSLVTAKDAEIAEENIGFHEEKRVQTSSFLLLSRPSLLV